LNRSVEHLAGPGLRGSRALSYRNIGCGRKRAAFWRSLGFPNLVLARKAGWKGHVRRDQRPKGFTLDTGLKLPWPPRGF